ncbi:MAG: hypothetical protein AB7L13_06870 [Acidimicrobiia bacterium]
MSWRVERVRGGAQHFHDRVLPDPAIRSIWIHEVERPALVLGSAQSDDIVAAEAASALGVDVVRRRSGGGAVLLTPGDTLWVDLVVPAGDVLWDNDVGRAFHWLGHVWSTALAAAGAGSSRVHTGPMMTTPLSRLVCFAGTGPGEVLIGGRKAVGMSQRRNRAGARFQCALYAEWHADVMSAVLAAHPPVEELAAVVHAFGASPSLAELESAFLAAVNEC